MQNSDLKRYMNWFYGYIAGFFGENDYINANLELKKEHTGYVVEEARYIAQGLGLDDNDCLIAETVALMHDVGRFEQFTKYLTYSDRKSISHSDLAVEIIEAEGVRGGDIQKNIFYQCKVIFVCNGYIQVQPSDREPGYICHLCFYQRFIRYSYIQVIEGADFHRKQIDR